MADDDTFDIDIYGDDTQQEAEQLDLSEHPQDEGANGDDFDYEGAEDFGFHSYQDQDPSTQAVAGDEENNQGLGPVDQRGREDQTPPKPVTSTQFSHAEINAPVKDDPETLVKAGTKRKASTDDYGDDERYSGTPSSRPAEPGATQALKLAELSWWTTEEDLRAFCVKAGVEGELKDLSFGEHKINGKSRGEAYLEFASPQAASATKRELEKEPEKQGDGARKVKYNVYFSHLGNPFRTSAGAAAVMN